MDLTLNNFTQKYLLETVNTVLFEFIVTVQKVSFPVQKITGKLLQLWTTEMG